MLSIFSETVGIWINMLTFLKCDSLLTLTVAQVFSISAHRRFNTLHVRLRCNVMLRVFCVKGHLACLIRSTELTNQFTRIP